MEASDGYNLLGQKLGPKGLQVRERLREAARGLMASQPMNTPTLTAVAAEAGVKVTATYRYYADVQALFADAMVPLREEMAPVIALLERSWRPGAVHREALRFVGEHFDYWRERRGALFLRNGLAEAGDARFIALRVAWAMPLYQALADKLATAHGRAAGEDDMAVAGVVLSGMERTTTLALQRWEDERRTSDRAGAEAYAAKQRDAAARIITTLMRHDYLET